jgi:hypothetical protein
MLAMVHNSEQMLQFKVLDSLCVYLGGLPLLDFPQSGKHRLIGSK